MAPVSFAMANTMIRDLPAFVTGSGHVGLIVIQEWWGLTEHICSITERFAQAAGALAVAPDLYHGKVATDAREAGHLMKGLDWSRAVADIGLCVEYLKAQGVERIAVMGFCMGGALTLTACAKVSGLAAGVCFYGIPPGEVPDIKCPMQLHFAVHDDAKGFSDPDVRRRRADVV